LAEFKALVRDQYSMLLTDVPAAIAALRSMLPPESDKRNKALALIKQVATSSGELPPEGQARLQEIAGIFGSHDDAALVPSIGQKTASPPSAPRSGFKSEGQKA